MSAPKTNTNPPPPCCPFANTPHTHALALCEDGKYRRISITVPEEGWDSLLLGPGDITLAEESFSGSRLSLLHASLVFHLKSIQHAGGDIPNAS